jgi:hypothetical protein
MATKRKAYTLSSTMAGQLPEIARRVLGGSGNGAGASAITPYDRSPSGLWVCPSGSALRTGKTNFWEYTLLFYESPFTTEPIPGMTAKGLNSYEITNTDTQASGYTINTSSTPPCGAIIGLSAVPAGTRGRYPAVGPFKFPDDDKFYYSFTDRNDPIIKTT